MLLRRVDACAVGLPFALSFARLLHPFTLRAVRSAKIRTKSPHRECLVTVLSEHAFVYICLSLENSAKRLDTVGSRTRVDSLPIATGTFRR